MGKKKDKQGSHALRVDDEIRGGAAGPSRAHAAALATENGGVEKKDAKKQRKELKRLRREARDAKAEGTVVVRVLGEGTANVHGPNAVGAVELKADHCPLPIHRIPELPLWVLGQGDHPPWATVRHKPLLRKVVLLMAGGVDALTFDARADLLPGVRARFRVPGGRLTEGPGVLAPSAALVRLTKPDAHPMYQVNQLLKVPARRKAKAEAQKDRKKRRAAEVLPFPAGHYCMAPADMARLNFPVPQALADGGVLCPEGFVATQPPGVLAPRLPAERLMWSEHIVALDCEMVTTAQGLELARCTMVDHSGRMIYDRLCLPDRPVLDYNTRYSGLTEAMLSACPHRIPDIQRDLLRLISSETILVGHSLENDLQALRLVHPRVIDTSFAFPHPKGHPWRSALRFLADKFLKRKIQDGSHDSAEDARAALDLAFLKIRNGPDYGTAAAQENLKEAIVDLMGGRCAAVDRRDAITRVATGACAAFPCDTDDEAVAKAQQAMKGADFVWCHLSALSEQLEARWHASAFRPADAGDTSAAAALGLRAMSARACEGGWVPERDPLVEAGARRLDAQVSAIYDAAPPGTLVMVFTGQGDTARNRRLAEVRAKRQSPEAREALGLLPWTMADEALYDRLNTRAMQAVLLVGVKGPGGSSE